MSPPRRDPPDHPDVVLALQLRVAVAHPEVALCQCRRRVLEVRFISTPGE